MRRSELLAMRWDDVDLEARTVLLRNTKNGHPRTVPLSPRALEIIRAMPRAGTPCLLSQPTRSGWPGSV